MRHWSFSRSARKQKNINKAFGETKGKSSYNREIESKNVSESESRLWTKNFLARILTGYISFSTLFFIVVFIFLSSRQCFSVTSHTNLILPLAIFRHILIFPFNTPFRFLHIFLPFPSFTFASHFFRLLSLSSFYLFPKYTNFNSSDFFFFFHISFLFLILYSYFSTHLVFLFIFFFSFCYFPSNFI